MKGIKHQDSSGQNTHVSVGGQAGNNEAMLTFALAIPAVVRLWACIAMLIAVLAMGGIGGVLWWKLDRVETSLSELTQQYKQADDRHKRLIQYVQEKDSAILTKKPRQASASPGKPIQDEDDAVTLRNTQEPVGE